KKVALRIGRESRVLNRVLGLHVVSIPDQFVPRICSDLGLPHEVAMKAVELLRLAPLKGRSQRVAAAGATYAAALILHRRVAQKAIGAAANVSEVSVRTALMQMCRQSEDVRLKIVAANTRIGRSNSLPRPRGE